MNIIDVNNNVEDAMNIRIVIGVPPQAGTNPVPSANNNVNRNGNPANIQVEYKTCRLFQLLLFIVGAVLSVAFCVFSALAFKCSSVNKLTAIAAMLVSGLSSVALFVIGAMLHIKTVQGTERLAIAALRSGRQNG